MSTTLDYTEAMYGLMTALRNVKAREAGALAALEVALHRYEAAKAAYIDEHGEEPE
jgi:hypothetical protein